MFKVNNYRIKSEFESIVKPYCSLSKCLFFLWVITLFLSTSLIIADKAPKYEKGRKRNPFIPYVTNDGQLTNIKDEEKDFSLNLEGIIYDKKGESIAIINSEILKENDTIAGIKLLEIRKDSVVYVKDGEIFIMELEKEVK